MAATRKNLLDRRAVVAAILKPRRNALVVTGLGSPTYDAAAAGDHPLNFYLWGAMGGAAMVGLGLALAQPDRRVLVVTGDGEMLMGLGSLATISVKRPHNLSIITIDNQYYGETGMQPSHTARVDLAGVARAADFKSATTIETAQQLKSWIPRLYEADGPLFVAIKVKATKAPATIAPRDGALSQYRFRDALLGLKERS